MEIAEKTTSELRERLGDLDGFIAELKSEKREAGFPDYYDIPEIDDLIEDFQSEEARIEEELKSRKRKKSGGRSGSEFYRHDLDSPLSIDGPHSI